MSATKKSRLESSKSEPPKGSNVVMDPEDGLHKAFASLPIEKFAALMEAFSKSLTETKKDG